jgi:FAD binding domain
VKASMLKSRIGAAVGKVTIEAFRRGFCGQALLPGDAGCDSARRIWNASIDKHPGLIVRCSDAADVVRAVKFSRANNLLVAVKSGGHNVAGRALCDDGIVIDLSAMNRVSVDPGLRTVRVQAGALLGDVDRETHPHDLAVPTGVVSKTGIAGLTLGGASSYKMIAGLAGSIFARYRATRSRSRRFIWTTISKGFLPAAQPRSRVRSTNGNWPR